MYIVKCIDLLKNKVFELEFYDYNKFYKFKNKCKYSKKIKIISIKDNSKFYN